jgi:cytoskeletal protein CcmA (bactofilin family)
MWRKPEESKPSAPIAEVPPAPKPEPVRSLAGLTAEVVQPSGGVVTSTLVIKGEIRGREDLYIDGEVQGTIHLTDGRVTVGPHGRISADVDAREILVRGKVKGSIRGRERVEVGKTGEINGNIVTLRIAIEEGAEIHSNVEISRNEEPRTNRAPEKSTPVASQQSSQPSSQQSMAMKAGADLSN